MALKLKEIIFKYNQNMINKTQMSNDERNEMIKMVNFLESELDAKMD